MSDVARQAGVSSAAASAVLSGTRSSVRVSEATRARIIEAAQELRYTRNEVARSLRRQSTDTLGLSLGSGALDTQGRFLDEIVRGLRSGCDAYQKDLLILGTFPGQSPDEAYRRLGNGKIDGLVLFSVSGDPLVAHLAAASLPIIAVAEAVPSLPSVVADDRAGAVLLVEYLAAQGYRKVLYRKGADGGNPSSLRPCMAFRDAAAAHRLVVWEDMGRPPGATDELSPQEKTLLRAPSGDRPVVVVCRNDDLAEATLRDCAALGLRVPQDVAVVGFGDLACHVQPSRRLTTLIPPWTAMARTAVDLLIRRLAGGDIPSQTTLPVRFVAGDTA